MALSSETRRSPRYIGTGSETIFPFAFKLLKPTDLEVRVALSGQVETTLEESAYTVVLNESQDNNPGGTVTLKAPLAKDAALVIISDTPYLQPTTYTNRGGFYPEQLNTNLDRLTILTQQLKEHLDRTITVPPTSPTSPQELFYQLLNAAKEALESAQSAEEALAACEQIRQLIEQYSWDIPHIVDSLRDVENYPYDGLFAVAGFGNAGGNGQNISNRYVKAEGSTELRTLGERFADVVNVRDFGAVGDGVTDDTEAIEAALAAGAGKTVFFPRGNYIVNGETNFSIQANTAILGAGWQTTAITTVNETGQLPYLFLVTGDNVSIEGLSFDGGRPETEKDQLLGRQGLVEYNGVYGYSGLTVNKCYIHDFCSRTIYTLANNTTVTHNRIERCSLFNADLSSMRGVVTNWYSPSADAKQMSNVIVENNHFIDCGHFAAG